MWRIVLEKGIPLTELSHWDLEDIRKMNALLDMQAAHSAAVDAWHEKKMKEQQKKVHKNGN